MYYLLALCCAIQILAAYKEMFTWEAFSDQVLGLPTLLDQRGVARDTRDDLIEMTGKLGLNQGLYNLFLAAGMIPGLIFGLDGGYGTLAVFSLLCMAVAGLFGAVTVPAPDGSNSNLRVFGAQAGAPIATLLAIWIGG